MATSPADTQKQKRAGKSWLRTVAKFAAQCVGRELVVRLCESENVRDVVANIVSFLLGLLG